MNVTYEIMLVLADAPRSLRNYVAALQAENERLLAERVDLEQYAVAIQYAIDRMRAEGGITNTAVARKLDSLLSLIDGQGTKV